MHTERWAIFIFAGFIIFFVLAVVFITFRKNFLLFPAFLLSPTPTPTSGAHTYKKIVTTNFWVGETADADNAYISNSGSYFDEDWQQHFGGVDAPENRCGFRPCGFTPKENPFYFALPYADLDGKGNLKASARFIPWNTGSSTIGSNTSLVKNRWIEIVYKGKACFAQWEDVGPLGEDDADYVFGTTTVPKNTFNQHAGLDLSPAAWDCLGMKDNDYTEWRFVAEKGVPSGP